MTSCLGILFLAVGAFQRIWMELFYLEYHCSLLSHLIWVVTTSDVVHDKAENLPSFSSKSCQGYFVNSLWINRLFFRTLKLFVDRRYLTNNGNNGKWQLLPWLHPGWVADSWTAVAPCRVRQVGALSVRKSLRVSSRCWDLIFGPHDHPCGVLCG